MARPSKHRTVGTVPKLRLFLPEGEHNGNDTVFITVEEYETIRLIDYLGKTQTECADIMGGGRTTIQNIYQSARKKLSKALVEGIPFEIFGSHYLFSADKETLGEKKIVSRGTGVHTRIAVTCGEDSSVSPFLHEKNLKIYDIAGGEIKESIVVPTENRSDKEIILFLQYNQIDILICGSMGGDVREDTKKTGIRLVSGFSGNADDAVKLFLQNSL